MRVSLRPLSGSVKGTSITAVHAIAVKVPRRRELLPKTAHGEVPSSEYALIQIETASGHRGVGEATTAPRWNGEDATSSTDLVKQAIGPALIGLAVEDWPSIASKIDSIVKNRPFLRTAIEMACLDAEARIRETSVARLLGTSAQTTFANKIVLPAREPETVEGMAVLALSRGATRLKVKVGTGLSEDLDRVTCVRNLHAGPLSVDANEGWSPLQTRELVAGIDKLRLSAVEQPFSRFSDSDSAELQRLITVPLVADESIWTMGDIRRIASSTSFRYVSLYPGKLGGMRRCVLAASVAEALGLGIVIGSNLELGLGTAAMAHVLSVIPVHDDHIGHDLIGPLYFEHSLVTDPSFVTFSETSLPNGHGLGVTLDSEAVDRYRFSSVDKKKDTGVWG